MESFGRKSMQSFMGTATNPRTARIQIRILDGVVWKEEHAVVYGHGHQSEDCSHSNPYPRWSRLEGRACSRLWARPPIRGLLAFKSVSSMESFGRKSMQSFMGTATN